MPAALADSKMYAELFGDAETAALFTDEAEIQAFLQVEGALARIQGGLGVIPAEAARFIDKAAREVKIDPAALAPETVRNGVPIPGLLAAFREKMRAPEEMRWLHWGATSQDVIDTGLSLRLKQLLVLWDARLAGLTAALGALALRHATLAMAGRTYGQFATPTSFGAVVAGWGRPLLAHRDRLDALKPGLLKVSLAGAAGTLSALGATGPETRSRLAEALGLTDPGHSWHSERDGLAAFTGWMAGLAASLGKMGEDLILMSQSGIGEIRIEGAGGSSTMPQKQNPVGPSALVALARQVVALSSLTAGAALHRQQRDGAAWFTEWLTLPQLCVSTGRALALATDLATSIVPDEVAMTRNLASNGGTIFAEALSFALADSMPRPEAVAAVKRLCAEALEDGKDLRDLAARDWPGVDWPVRLSRGMMGEAPAEARAFAARANT